jgi:hypothetical protein
MTFWLILGFITVGCILYLLIYAEDHYVDNEEHDFDDRYDASPYDNKND